MIREATYLTFDGSIGPTGEWTCIGWAYLIELTDGSWSRRSGHRSGRPSNPMVAEFEGLLHGLRWFGRDSSKAMTAATSRIVVRGDSKPVIDLLNGGSTRNKALRSMQDEAEALLEKIRLPWEAKHILKRFNKECDGLTQAELARCLRVHSDESLSATC